MMISSHFFWEVLISFQDQALHFSLLIFFTVLDISGFKLLNLSHLLLSSKQDKGILRFALI